MARALEETSKLGIILQDLTKFRNVICDSTLQLQFTTVELVLGFHTNMKKQASSANLPASVETQGIIKSFTISNFHRC